MSKEKDIVFDTLSETAQLNKYLKSRGINPEFVSKDQKVAHSKTNQFKIWMQAHANDPIREGMSQEHTPTEKRLHALKKSMHFHKEIRVADGHKQLHSEAVDKKDTITFDIPLLIRVLEFAREDLKSDIALHQMVERLINIRGKGTLSMNEYGKIVKEEVESLDEVSKETLHAYATAGHKKYDEIRHKNDPTSISKKAKLVKGIKRANQKMYPPVQHKPEPKIDMSSPEAYYKSKSAAGQRYVGDSVEIEGQPIQEVSSDTLGRYKEKAKLSADELASKGQYKKSTNRWMNVMKATGKQIEKTTSGIKSSLNKENLEPMAANNQPCDCANSSDDVAPKRSAKLKLLLGGKKRAIKEEMYDHEKEDKSTAPLGKKVKFTKPGMDDVTKEQPKAAAILSGGKTMTGEPRDTIEIDPMMKMKKQSPDSQKSV